MESYRKCFVPKCNNDSKNSNKTLVRIREDLRQKWCHEVNIEYFKVYVQYCCEDHFDPKQDLINYYYKSENKEPRFKPTAKLRNLPINLRNTIKDNEEIEQGAQKDLHVHSNALSIQSQPDESQLAKLLLQPGIQTKKRTYEDMHMASTSGVISSQPFKKMSCVIEGCNSHTGRKEHSEEISFHCFPKNDVMKQKWILRVCRPKWTWKKRSIICSRHFTPNSFIPNTKTKWRRLKPDALPSLFLSDTLDRLTEHVQVSSRIFGESHNIDNTRNLETVPLSMMEICDVESSAQSCIPIVKLVAQENVFVKVEMQDPLHQTDQESSLRESQLQKDVEPHMSAVPEVKKEEEEEDDYRAMFFKIQEEVTALRVANQSLSEENQILTERSQKLAKEIDNLLEKNNNLATVIEYRNKEHVIFTERITQLTHQNECLAKKIQRFTEKCNEEFQSDDMLGNDCDELQKIEVLTKQLQALLEKNKCLHEEKESLVERNEKMAETVRKLVEDNARLKIQLGRNSRLKNCTAQGEEMKSRKERDQEIN